MLGRKLLLIFFASLESAKILTDDLCMVDFVSHIDEDIVLTMSKSSKPESGKLLTKDTETLYKYNLEHGKSKSYRVGCDAMQLSATGKG